MKSSTCSILLFLCMGISMSVFGQSESEAPIKFEVFSPDQSANKTPAIVWYVEQAGLSNAGGVQVAAFTGGYDALILRLEALRSDSRVASFKLDRAAHQLHITMKGLSGEKLAAVLQKHIADYKAPTH